MSSIFSLVVSTINPFIISIASVVKTYGQPLKAACAMVRLRLYDALSLVPPQYYEGNLFS